MEIVRYPDSRIETLDQRFAQYKLPNAAVEMLWTGGRWLEGPVWFGDGRYLLFSDIPNNRILKWEEETGEVSVYRKPSNNTNGNTRDRHGRLISCEHDSRRVTRTEHDGSVTVMIDGFDGRPLNAPNDVVVKSDGSIWFTDPGYGSMGNYEGHKGELELKESVYRIDAATGEIAILTDEAEKPNGLCFSPDYKTLYVADTGGSQRDIKVWDVVDGTRLARGRRLTDMVIEGVGSGGSDGIRADVDGNIWSSAGWGGEGFDGVHIFAPDGTRIGQILLPEVCSNICFGGTKRNRLFMTASQSLYVVYVETRGAHIA